MPVGRQIIPRLSFKSLTIFQLRRSTMLQMCIRKLLSTILIVSATVIAYAQLPTAAEYSALIDLYNSTNGSNWTNKNGWATANPAVIEDVSDWYGVLTDANGHVDIIDLDGIPDFSYFTNSSGYQVYPGNNLTGTLPASMGNLSWLRAFNVGGNHISGSIPQEIGQLNKLQWFIAAFNELSGTIPETIGNITPLDRIFLEHNQLTGAIPNSIGNLVNLWAIQVNNNQLTGSIPESFGNLTQLVYFSLEHNALSGAIPSSIGNMQSLTSVGFNNNQLTGTIPESLGNLGAAMFLVLGNNQLSGNIPSSLANLNNLRFLGLENNNLTGPIPAGLAAIPSLGNISLENNRYRFADLIPFKNAYTGALTANPQQLVDVAMNHLAAGFFTLSTTIDRQTNPPSNYQWFKLENSVATPLNTASAAGHTITVSSSGQWPAGVSYYYQITNTVFPGLMLKSRERTISASSSSVNYVKTITPTVSGFTSEIEVENSSSDQSTTVYDYFDGLGRPIQKVIREGSPLRKDLVQPMVYDEFGREPIKYLPFAAGSDGSYKPTSVFMNSEGHYDAAGFYSGVEDLIAVDQRPFSETVFEPSPLHRPSREYGAGQSWSATGSNKYVEHQFRVNSHAAFPLASATSEAVILWEINTQGNLIHTGYYASNELLVKVTVDENGNATREYTDKQGQIILKKIQALPGTQATNNLNDLAAWASTYYVYNDLNQLVFVLQPEGLKQYLAIIQP